MTTKISKVGRPKVDSERVDTRMPRDMLERLDAWAADQPDKPSRPEAVRRLVDKGLGT